MKNENGLNDLLMLVIILSSFFGWIIIYIGIWKYRRNGRCPKSRICKDSECKWGTWCKKYDRYVDQQKYLCEILREQKKREKNLSSKDSQ